MRLKLRSKRNVSPVTISCDDSYGSDGATTVSAVSALSTLERSSSMSSKYLDELMFDGRWDEAASYVKQNGRHAMKYRRAPQFMNVKEDSFVLPIHVALTKADVPLEFLEALVFAYPNSLMKHDSSLQRGCLHIAIKSRVPDHIISYLIHAYPGGARLQDVMGRLPLHYAISNLRSLSLISALIVECPRSIWAQDKMGWSPLHVASGTSLDVIKLLLSKSQETITLTTTRGRTPLVIAEESEHKNKQEIVLFLQDAQKALERLPVFQNLRNAEKNGKNIFAIMSETCLA